MPSTAYRRHICIIVAATALLVLADLLMLPGSNVSVSRNSITELSKGVGLGVFYMALAKALGIGLTRLSGIWRTLLKKITSGVNDAGIFLALFSTFSAVDLLTMYLAAATHRPLMDAHLAAIDHALGFDWLAVVRFANSFSAVAAVMVFCYASTPYQIASVALYHLIRDNRERLFEFAATLAVSLVFTNAVMFVVPPRVPMLSISRMPLPSAISPPLVGSHIYPRWSICVRRNRLSSCSPASEVSPVFRRSTFAREYSWSTPSGKPSFSFRFC